MSDEDYFNQESDDSSQQLTRATVKSSDLTVKSADSSSSHWQRINLNRSWIWFEIPVVLVILTVATVLAAQFLTNDSSRFLRMVFTNMSPDVEPSVGTWLNAVLWLVAGLVAGYIALHVHQHRASWAAISILCAFFSLDETMLLHDNLDRFSASLEQILPVATFVWIIPASIVTLVIVGLLLRMVLSLPRKSRNGLIAGGAIFMFGTILVEGLGGVYYFALGGEEVASVTYSYIALTMFEEFCEMTGVALAIAAMLHLIERRRLDGGTAYRVNIQRHSGTLKHS